MVEPFEMEGQGGGMVIALRTGGFRDADRDALDAFAASVSQRLAAERSVEIERLRFGMQAREHERTRWAREIHDESIQGIGALRLQLANARDVEDPEALRAAVDAALEGLGHEIDGLRHLITELRPAALDDLGLAAALRRSAQARPGDRRPRREDRDRPFGISAQPRPPRTAARRGWTPSSRAPSTGSRRRPSPTSAATRRPRSAAVSVRRTTGSSSCRSPTTAKDSRTRSASAPAETAWRAASECRACASAPS